MDVGRAILEILLLIIGFILLVKGADFFVDGASGIAKKLKISTFIIGVTVVAIGTSAPELAVTVVDAVGGEGDLILGNILGSNAINVFMILGISALVCKLPVEKSSRIVDLPFLIIIGTLFVILGSVGSNLVWWEGLILVILYAAFMVYNVILATKQSKISLEQATAVSIAEGEAGVADAESSGFFAKLGDWYQKMSEKVWFLIVITLAGLAMVVGGAQLVVNSAEYIAEELFHIPTEIVALTVVAFGTSLPELVTSVSAARKGDVGIATGNIIGSNIANILLIGGVGALCSGSAGIAFTTEAFVSGCVSLLAAVLVFAFSFGKSKSLGKAAGVVLLACLILYYGFIILNLYQFKLY